VNSEAAPPDRPAATPSGPARWSALAAIVIAGICGGLIGYAFVDLQCEGNCTLWAGLGGLAGAVMAATGVAIVAVLTLRAMDEWETIQRREDADTS
jgi:hypothetical protein